MTVNKAFAMKISNLLIERKMNRYQLEKLSGVSHGNMGRIFYEKQKTVTLTTAIKIARAFNMKLTEFVDDELFENLDLELE